MFDYIRLFSFLSLLFIAVLAWGVGLYGRGMVERGMIDMVTHQGSAVAYGYQEAVWRDHRESIARLAQVEPMKWRRYPQYTRFREATQRFMEGLPLAGATLYTPDGIRIAHLDPNADTPAAVPEAEAGDGALARFFGASDDAEAPGPSGAAPKPLAQLSESAAASHRGEGGQGPATLLSVYLPLKTPEGARAFSTINRDGVEAVLKLDYDVSARWRQLAMIHYGSVAGITAIFCLILGLLLYLSRRAEGIIARQHEMNLELTAAAAAAESENRDKSMFLANISHELRTPLNAIIGFSDILSTEAAGVLEARQLEYLQDINSSGTHLLSLINDILDFSKAESGKLEIDVSEIDVLKMAKNSVRLMIPRAETAQVTLVEDLPKKSFVMQTDAKKLKQILLNLLSNSVKFTPSRGEVKISLWQDHGLGRVMFVVSDTGIGISPKNISKVMAPFGQVESDHSRKYAGTGLGLPLSKKLVELLGGSFTIESEEGVGTTITLNMPLNLNPDDVQLKPDDV